ncbi:hypothetical protein CAAN1_29S00958 [[Candida] anglica]|uniref:Zn(2)-C6 fungal-type domain-containing protein n=1 Tax=[Candida] anglica TaxID=148631 RepID=A0ABP0EBS8_9ASCO
MGDNNLIRRSQRPPKSCFQCSKRRVKCNKEIPCDTCIRRGKPDLCYRERVMVGGEVLNKEEHELERLQIENKLLRERAKNLELAFDRSKFAEQNQAVVKKNIDLYSNSIHVATHYFDTRNIKGFIAFDKKSYIKLSTVITRDVSTKLVNFHLEKLLFFHLSIQSETFQQEHSDFWNDASNPKHITLEIDRTLDEYLWCAIWYAVLSGSFFTLDEQLEKDLGMNEEEAFELARLASTASLECLHRGQFLRYPNIRSVQAFCILALCFHGFSGVHLQNTLLSAIIYVAKVLNLHCLVPEKMTVLDYELGSRMWWVLVIIDWLEVYNRDSLLSPSDFTTKMPRDIAEVNLLHSYAVVTDEVVEITYNKFLVDHAYVRRHLYYDTKIDVSDLSISGLKLARHEIYTLKNKSLDRYKEKCFAKFLLKIKFTHEIMEINRMLLSYIPEKEWLQSERFECLTSAMSILVDITDSTIPSYYRKYWLPLEHSVSACVYLLLDIIIIRPLSPEDTRMELLTRTLPILKSLQSTHLSASSGLLIIEPLFHSALHPTNSKFEPTQINNLLENLNALPKIHMNEPGLKSNIHLNSILEDKEWKEFLKLAHSFE